MGQNYTYPDAPNVETRQIVGSGLRGGRITSVAVEAPRYPPAQNTTPNPYAPQGNVTPPGTQTFATAPNFREWPIRTDSVQRDYHISIEDKLFYRSNQYVNQSQLPTRRIVTPSITQPELGARFINARGRGDVYGA